MTEKELNNHMKTHRWSFGWLLVASILLLVSNGRWIVPIAAWLYPVFMVRFLRSQKPIRGFVCGYCAIYLVSAFHWKGLMPIPAVMHYQLIAVIAFGVAFSFVADRLLAPRIGGFLSTLVLPVAWVSIEYVLARANPFGSWLFTSYSQFPNLSLLQVLSVTGMSGLTFLMAWFASVVNWIWERDFAWSEVRAGLTLYATVLLAVLVGGGIRLAFLPPQGSTVRIASLTAGWPEIHPDVDVIKRLLSTGELTDSELKAILATTTARYDKLFERSLKEIRAGAKIIVWPEGATYLLQEDEENFLNKGRETASREGVYLVLTAATIHRNPERRPQGKPIVNKLFLIDSDGKTAFEYVKAVPVPWIEGPRVVRGPRRIPTVDTPYGRLACVICYDMDFPTYILQAGKADVDILFAPSNDWKEIDPIHTHMAAFRAIENGFSLVRHTSNGLSMAVDYQGRILAAMDHFKTTDRVMVSHVPVKGVSTIYSRIGDVLGLTSIAAFLALIWKAVAGRNKN